MLTASGFKRWRETSGMTQAECADALGISKSTVALYEKGKRSEGEVSIPRTVALACIALTHDLPALSDEWANDHRRLVVDVSKILVRGKLPKSFFEWANHHLKHSIVVENSSATFFTQSDAVKFHLAYFDSLHDFGGLSKEEYIRELIRKGREESDRADAER